jgi:endo-1,3-1,4-beta-glycanase ExoK
MRSIGAAAFCVVAAFVIPRTAEAVASAELYRTQAYFYGRFEARIRYAAGDGVVSSFFLWKEGSDATNAYWNELDYEKVGPNCDMKTNAIYGNPQVQRSQTTAMPGDVCAQYHDYRFEWTPTYIAWAVDGQELRRDTGETATAFSQNATSGMTFHFNDWPGNSNFGGNFNPSILPVRQYISWVQYSSYSNGSFQLEWREDFDGASVPSGWATGTWSSPYGLSTHNPANVSFVNGIAVLSMTADNATGFTGTPPPDGSGSGGAGSGGANTGGTSNTGGKAASGGASNGGTSSTGGAPSGGTSNRGGSTAVGGSSSTTGGTLTGTGGTANQGGATTGPGGATTGPGGATTGLGGAATGLGGATTGRGGATTGGAADSGGVSAALGGSRATGGTSANTGGTTTATQSATGGALGSGVGGTPSSGSAGAPQAATATSVPADAGGCGCRVAGEGGNRFAFAAFGLLGLLLAGRRKTASLRAHTR